jgi:hypothetical protein
MLYRYRKGISSIEENFGYRMLDFGTITHFWGIFFILPQSEIPNPQFFDIIKKAQYKSY